MIEQLSNDANLQGQKMVARKCQKRVVQKRSLELDLVIQVIGGRVRPMDELEREGTEIVLFFKDGRTLSIVK